MATRETSEAFEALKEYLILNYKAKSASGGKEIIKKCHYCGDSKDPKKAHMYIGMRDGSIVFNCFKCNRKGVVDAKFLREIGCYDERLTHLILEQNRIGSSSNSTNLGKFGSGFRTRHFNIPPNSAIVDDIFINKKIEYLSSRLGFPLDSAMVARFKIILSLKQFLSFNGINYTTRSPEVIDAIDKYFVGFMSADNKYIVFRRSIYDDGIQLPEDMNDMRYVNYNIYGDNSNASKHYIIPNQINLLYPLSIYMAEGIFDILSVFINTQNNFNGIFVSVNGKSYANIIKSLIKTYGISNFTLHIYADADVNDKMFLDLREELRPFNVTFFIHRNSYPGEKDFGVPASRINDSFRQIF